MKSPLQRRTPFRAWLASLPLALALPTVGWIVVYGIFLSLGDGDLRSNTMLSGIFLGASVVVHLLAYLLTGLPLFLCCHKKNRSPLWMPGIAIPFGALLGILMTTIMLRQGNPIFEPGIFVTGAGYGAATAIAALRQRPTPV